MLLGATGWAALESLLNSLIFKTKTHILETVISTYVSQVLTVLKTNVNSKFIGGIQVLKPLGDRVILDQPEEQEETVGGIVLASNAQEKPQTANVVAVGDGRVLDNGDKVAPSVKVGDKVLFDKYAGTEVKYQDQTYLVLHEKDLVAVID